MTHTPTPIRQAFLDRVRQAQRDDLGQPVRRLVASGGEPLRDVLRRARPGEEILLASYCPFKLAGPYREYGPVFVLAQPYESAGLPPGLQAPGEGATDYWRVEAPLVVRAYSAQEDIVTAQLARPAEIGEVVAGYFASLSHCCASPPMAAMRCAWTLRCRVERSGGRPDIQACPRRR